MNVKWLRAGTARLIRNWLPRVSAIYRRRSDEQYARARAKLISHYGLTVQAGPFAGIKYIDGSNCLTSKLVGCFEAELHAVIEYAIQQANFDCVVNIGSAEGYYAVGLAYRLANIPVYAFEMDEQARSDCAQQAILNGLRDRLVILGEATVDELRGIHEKYWLIVIDCEGCELSLLDPQNVEQLRNATIIVEIHDHVNPLISKVISERFELTHNIQHLYPSQRMSRDYPKLHVLNRIEQHYAMYEHRAPYNQWAFLTPKSAITT